MSDDILYHNAFQEECMNAIDDDISLACKMMLNVDCIMHITLLDNVILDIEDEDKLILENRVKERLIYEIFSTLSLANTYEQYENIVRHTINTYLEETKYNIYFEDEIDVADEFTEFCKILMNTLKLFKLDKYQFAVDIALKNELYSNVIYTIESVNFKKSSGSVILNIYRI